MKILKFFLNQLLFCLFFVILMGLFILYPNKIDALTTFQTTLSSGYYKNIEQADNITLFYNLKLNELHSTGVETFIEMDLNNHFIEDKWKVYPYQFYVTVPFNNGFDSAPFHNSRIQIGRQLLTEGFEINILNGLVYRNYWTPDLGIVFFGGSLDTLGNNKISTTDQITGSSFFFKKWDSNFQLGPLMKKNESESRYFGNLSFMRSWNFLPLTPLLMLKGQWDFMLVKNRKLQF